MRPVLECLVVPYFVTRGELSRACENTGGKQRGRVIHYSPVDGSVRQRFEWRPTGNGAMRLQVVRSSWPHFSTFLQTTQKRPAQHPVIDQDTRRSHYNSIWLALRLSDLGEAKNIGVSMIQASSALRSAYVILAYLRTWCELNLKNLYAIFLGPAAGRNVLANKLEARPILCREELRVLFAADLREANDYRMKYRR